MAVADPEGFARAVAGGKIKAQSTGVLDSTLRLASSDTHDQRQDEQAESDTEIPAGPEDSNFRNVPRLQNVVRCPPINWAKYHVLGEPLDKLHEEQRRRPVNDQHLQDESQIRGEEHIIAAPYDPWRDKLRFQSPNTNQAQDGSHHNG